MSAFPNLHPCPECGDDAALATAPGPGEPINEYDCTSCAHQFTVGPAVLAPARPYPNLHRIAYGEGARLTAEARVEAADALERLARTCVTCAKGEALATDPRVWCFVVDAPRKPDHFCGFWEPQPLTPAHDKEKP